MSRKDLRSSESEWRGMSSAQRQPKPIKAPKKSIITVANILWIAAFIVGALVILHVTAPSKVFSACEGTAVSSNICKG